MELVTIERFESASQARIAMNALLDAGIRATVVDENAGSTLWHVGTALGGVKLQVAASDAERAMQILRDGRRYEAIARPTRDWTCRACGEEIEREFAVCWNCGAAHDGTADPSFAHAVDRDEDEEEPDEPEVMERDSDESLATDTANPYASPAASSQPQPPTPVGEPPAPNETDVLLQRAWRASIVGWLFVVFFAFLNIYSVFLLLKSLGANEQLSSRQTKRFYWTLLVNLLAFVAFVAFLVNVMPRAER